MAVRKLAIGIVLDEVEVLVDGPFVESLARSAAPRTGSGNQRVIDLEPTRRSGRAALLDPTTRQGRSCPRPLPHRHTATPPIARGLHAREPDRAGPSPLRSGVGCRRCWPAAAVGAAPVRHCCSIGPNQATSVSWLAEAIGSNRTR
jgi:hypothetical protein